MKPINIGFGAARNFGQGWRGSEPHAGIIRFIQFDEAPQHPGL